MNGCKEVALNFDTGYYLNSDCGLDIKNSNDYTLSYYLNLSKITFDKLATNSGSHVTICKYDKDKNMVSRIRYTGTDLDLGSNIIDLEENYFYRFDYSNNFFGNFRGYQCNVGIGSMSNELAFGSVNFLDTISTLIPFVIILIGFGLGFTLLKRLIKKSSKGSA